MFKRTAIRLIVSALLAALMLPLVSFASSEIYAKLNNHYRRGNVEVVEVLAQKELANRKLDKEERLVVLHHMILVKGVNDLRDADKYLKAFKQTYLAISREIQKKSKKPNTVQYYIDVRLLDSYYLSALYDAINENHDDAYLMFVMLQPHNFNTEEYWGWFGISAQKVGAYDTSLAAFRQQQKLNPKNPAIPYNIACTFAKKGERKAALRELKKAISMNPKFKTEAKGDSDFKVLHNDAAFIKLTSR